MLPLSFMLASLHLYEGRVVFSKYIIEFLKSASNCWLYALVENLLKIYFGKRQQAMLFIRRVNEGCGCAGLRYVFIGIFTWNMALLYHVGVQSSLLLARKDYSKQSSQM